MRDGKVKTVLEWLMFPVAAVITALVYALFVFPNEFAPAGVGGIVTMVQHLLRSDAAAGWLNFFVNIPILIIAWFILNREFVLKTASFTLVFSVMLIVFGSMDLSRFAYHTETGTSNVLAPIAAGVINGFLYGNSVRCHGCTGGTDVIAACVQRKRPEFSMIWISFSLNAVIAAASYFVYDFKFEPVICCIVYSFVSSTMGERIWRGSRAALKFEIICDDTEAMAKDLMDQLHHGVTMVHGEGMYTHKERDLVICIVNKHQIADVERIVKSHKGSFAYVSNVTNTFGLFRKVK